MKQLEKQNKKIITDRTARELLETVPSIMRAIRGQMRSHRSPELSVPQFRALNFLHHHEGASLNEVAEHAGLKPPTMSKMIDALTVRGLVERRTHPEDRRRVTLALSERGRELWREAREATNTFLAERVSELSEDDLALVGRAMEALRPLFAASGKTGAKEARQG